MKRKLDKGILFLLLGLVTILCELGIVNSRLEELNVITYLLVIGLLPAVILFFSSFLYSLYSVTNKKMKYSLAIVLAIIFSIIMLLYCGVVITPDVVEIIIANSITSETTQASMNTASIGDNIQSILLFVAFSGIGAIIGNRINKKRDMDCSKVDILDEYDN